MRMLDELKLVGILDEVGADGKPVPRGQIVDHLLACVEAEREMIRRHGRKLAAKVYGYFEGRSSDVKVVDFVMSYDYSKWAEEIVKEGLPSKPM